MPTVLHPDAPLPGSIYIEFRPATHLGDVHHLIEVIRHVPQSRRYPDRYIDIRVLGRCDADGNLVEPISEAYGGDIDMVFRVGAYALNDRRYARPVAGGVERLAA